MCWLFCWCSTTGDVFSQQFDDMLGLLQSLEARLTDLHGRSVSLRKVLFLVLSVTFLFVYGISREPLNRCAPNSHGRHVWSLPRTSLIRLPACRLCLEKHLCSSLILGLF